MPSRIQRRRTAGWKMPEGAIYVGRPSRWGNPYEIAMMQNHIDMLCGAMGITDTTLDARQLSVEAFRCDLNYGPDSHWWWFGPHMQMIRIKADLHELRGRDLACWCRLDQPCHADVLLELANEVH